MQERTCFISDIENVVRFKIDKLFSENPISVVRVDGIEIERLLDEIDEMRYSNCSYYTLGCHNQESVDDQVVSKGVEVGFEKGAIAVYFSEHDEILHVGRVVADGTIVSKWGPSGHIYKHKPWLVPSRYGKKIRCFSLQSSS